MFGYLSPLSLWRHLATLAGFFYEVKKLREMGEFCDLDFSNSKRVGPILKRPLKTIR